MTGVPLLNAENWTGGKMYYSWLDGIQDFLHQWHRWHVCLSTLLSMKWPICRVECYTLHAHSSLSTLRYN